MRLIRLCTNAQAYLNQFYRNHSDFLDKPYKIQYQKLMADSYGWADFWTHALAKLGYEVWEPVGNAEPIQKTWAAENRVHYHKKTWFTDIATAQVKQFKPEVIFVNDYSMYNADFFEHIRRVCPSVRLVIGWCGAPYKDANVFKAYDLVLSNIPSLVTHFRTQGHHSQYMCHAFEPRLLEKVNPNLQVNIDFSFIGSIVKGDGFHNQREQLIRKLVKNTPLEIWSNTPQISKREKQILPLRQMAYDLIHSAAAIPQINPILNKLPKIRGYANLNQRPSLNNYVHAFIASRAHPAVYGLAMYQKLLESKVTLNTHIDISSRFASNMRLFEATGIGTCLLTEYQENLPDLFEPDVEIVTYRCLEEAIEKCHYLLEHEEERLNIAHAGQKRTLREHTIDLRAQQFDELVKEYI